MLEYISSIKDISFLAVKKKIKHGIIQDNIFCQLKLWISFDLYEQNKHEIIKILKGVVCVSFCKLSEDLLLWYTCTSMFIFEGDHCYWRLSSRSVPPGLKKNSDGRPGSYSTLHVKRFNLQRTKTCACFRLTILI